jgi:peptide deformylase
MFYDRWNMPLFFAPLADGARIADTGGMPVLRQIAQLGHPALRAPNRGLSFPLGRSVEALIADMFATLEESGGVGLAAPQVHENARIVIVASRPTARYPAAPLMEPTLMINPALLWESAEREEGWEGCLSIPGLRGRLARASAVRVEFAAIDGAVRTLELTGFPARVFQHEHDHLRGMLFTDRVESPRDLFSEREYQRITS